MSKCGGTRVAPAAYQNVAAQPSYEAVAAPAGPWGKLFNGATVLDLNCADRDTVRLDQC